MSNRVRTKNLDDIIDKVLETLSPVLYYYFEKYQIVDKEKTIEVSAEDGEIIANILKSRLNNMHEIASLLEYMGQPSEWMYGSNFCNNFNLKFFWDSFSRYRKGADLLQRLLMDARNLVKPADADIFQ